MDQNPTDEEPKTEEGNGNEEAQPEGGAEPVTSTDEPATGDQTNAMAADGTEGEEEQKEPAE